MASTNPLFDANKLDTVFQENAILHHVWPGRTETWIRQRQLAVGSFGEVWLEQENASGQLRAVKVIPRLTHTHSKTNGGELAALIDMKDRSAYFVKFLGFFENSDSIYIAMEYIEYGNLADYIKQQGANAKMMKAEVITSQILWGLAELHNRGFCHRDIKPQNILIASLSPIWVKITDLEFVRTTRETNMQSMTGTVNYLAPEIMGLLPRAMRAKFGYTNAVDLWSLGVVVYEMLCSEIPFLQNFSDTESLRGFDFGDASQTMDLSSLVEYCRGVTEFPMESLRRNGVSIEGIEFVTSLMAPNPKSRVSAAQALQSQWIINSSQNAVSIPHIWHARQTTQPTVSASRSIEGVPPSRDLGTDVPAPLARQDNQSSLEEAASTGDVDRIKPLVESGAKINWAPVNQNGQTALYAAASGGHLNAIKLLLSMGANINGVSASDNGQTALHAAAGGGDLAAIQLLVQMGAKVDAWSPSKHGQTALHAAASGGHLDAIQLLLKMGANVHGASASQHGQTALHAAAAGGHLAAIKLLLGTGVNVDASSASENGQSALNAAAAGGNLGAMKLLFAAGANVNAASASQNGQSALHAAAAGGHLGAIQWLFNVGAKVDGFSASLNGQTALHAAAAGGHIDAVKLLLELGANVNGASGSPNGQTALHGAASGGHLEAMNLLLKSGANVNTSAASENSQSALHAAAAHGHLGAITLLLDKGAVVDGASCGKNGQTALHAAAGGGHVDAIKLLLDRGASVRLQDHSATQDPHIVVLLENNQPTTPLEFGE